jgi:hypothetical protein
LDLAGNAAPSNHFVPALNVNGGDLPKLESKPMSTDIDPKVADLAPTNESTDQDMGFGACRLNNVTYLTLKATDVGPLMAGFGTKNPDFFFGLVRQAANAVAPKGRYPDEDGIKFMLAFIKDSKPRDESETMLITQMAATHVAAMRFANRLSYVESIQEQDSAERAYNKLARTFAMQMETLQRHRTTSESKVIVQNVSVSDGGQAIVGNVTGATHETAVKKRAPVTPKVADARQSPMETIGEPKRASVALQRRQNG